MIHQPDNINQQESVEFLKRLEADIFVVVAFGQILSKRVLAIPKILSLNLHASLLPKYRGAAPIRWAIINGETQTGVTIIKLVEKLDAGPIILQKRIDINDYDNAISLEDKLSLLGGELISQALDLIQDKKHSLVIQDEREASYAPKLKKQDGLINWDKSTRSIFNLIRGCAGWPGAHTDYRDKILKIHKVSLISSCLKNDPSVSLPGRVIQVSKQGIVVATGDGNLLIEELQMEGKKRMAACEFISGFRISVGECLGEKN
jgi:methionyl-tRNA formyltransferase